MDLILNTGGGVGGGLFNLLKGNERTHIENEWTLPGNDIIQALHKGDLILLLFNTFY